MNLIIHFTSWKEHLFADCNAKISERLEKLGKQSKLECNAQGNVDCGDIFKKYNALGTEYAEEQKLLVSTKVNEDLEKASSVLYTNMNALWGKCIARLNLLEDITAEHTQLAGVDYTLSHTEL